MFNINEEFFKRSVLSAGFVLLFGKTCCFHVFPSATSVVGLADFFTVSPMAGRPLAACGVW